MLHNANKLLKYAVHARDGTIGSVKDIYFDDAQWIVRYFVVETGTLLKSHKVLLSPEAINRAEWASATEATSLMVDLTQKQIASSPSVDLAKPVSRQQEEQVRRYFGWPAYWLAPAYAAGYTVGGVPTAAPLYANSPAAQRAAAAAVGDAEGDPHLRSCSEVKNYHLAAVDGEIGHVEDFLVSDRDWDVAYLVVDTRNWLPGRKVIVSPSWVREIDWSAGRVLVDLDRATIQSGPAYDPDRPITESYSRRLHEHFGRPPYVGW